MDLSHQDLVVIAKTFGLLYLVTLSIGVLLYAYWPSLGKKFDRAANSIIDDEDGPVLADPKLQDKGR